MSFLNNIQIKATKFFQFTLIIKQDYLYLIYIKNLLL